MKFISQHKHNNAEMPICYHFSTDLNFSLFTLHSSLSVHSNVCSFSVGTINGLLIQFISSRFAAVFSLPTLANTQKRTKRMKKNRHWQFEQMPGSTRKAFHCFSSLSIDFSCCCRASAMSSTFRFFTQNSISKSKNQQWELFNVLSCSRSSFLLSKAKFGYQFSFICSTIKRSAFHIYRFSIKTNFSSFDSTK